MAIITVEEDLTLFVIYFQSIIYFPGIKDQKKEWNRLFIYLDTILR